MINLADIGGPSAGLIFALAVVDKLTPGELNGGPFVAGTGEIDPDGRRGPDRRHPVQAERRAGGGRDSVPGAGGELRRGTREGPGRAASWSRWRPLDEAVARR